MKPCAALIGMACLLIAGVRVADTAADELAKLKGDWKVMSKATFVLNPDSLKPFRMDRNNWADSVHFDGEKVKFLVKGDKHSELTVKLDPANSPKTIDLVLDGKTWMGIYELKDDTLKMCLLEGKERPTDITGAKHATGKVAFIAYTLKRSK